MSELTEKLQQQLQWRYAVKKFDAAQKISSSQWSTLENALLLTPSSYGLQPWRFLVVKSDEVKQQLKPFSWNQSQVSDCSHYVIFCAMKKMTEEYVTKFILSTAQARGQDPAQLEGYKKMIISDVVSGPRSERSTEWAARQCYIALGNFMTSAALIGVDTCPIEGFQPDKYDALLKLDEQNLTSVVCCAAGFRSGEDKYSAAKKVRFNSSEMLHYL